MFEQVMMVGAGGVGGFFGAHLARAHPERVSFLLRPQTLEAIKAKGLTIRSPHEVFTVHPRAAADPRELPNPDLIVLGVKAYDLPEAMRELAPIIREEVCLLTLQNGVTIEDQLCEAVGRERVVGGVAFIYAKIASPGVIEHYKRGVVTIGELMGQETPRVVAIADLFREAGIACHISRDIRKAKWEKMCWNCVFNPLTVVLNDKVAAALDHPEMSELIEGIVREVTAVAMAHRIPLPDDMPRKVVEWSQELRDIHTSMYDDWKRGRRTEIEFLNGYIAAQGKAKGIPTPLNHALTALIKAITGSEDSRTPVLKVEGAVLQPLSFDCTALEQLASCWQIPDVGALDARAKGRGVRVEGLLDCAAIQNGADHVTFYSADDRYAVSLTIEQARRYGVILYQIDGQPLPIQQGGPFRLLAPGLGDLCANVKQLSRIVLTRGPGPDTRPSRAGSAET
ncbi:MAG: 2-dehydropantoate 2-reductase [Nitrospirae bacterium]|nr:MAG: 2-dehydropantoate 2-reductase [Nitrospirota bacterium]